MDSQDEPYICAGTGFPKTGSGASMSQQNRRKRYGIQWICNR